MKTTVNNAPTTLFENAKCATYYVHNSGGKDLHVWAEGLHDPDKYLTLAPGMAANMRSGSRDITKVRAWTDSGELTVYHGVVAKAAR